MVGKYTYNQGAPRILTYLIFSYTFVLGGSVHAVSDDDNNDDDIDANG